MSKRESQSDKLYAKYREGVIKRHIASNGLYVSYIWLRSKDAVDWGGVNDWPNPETTVNVNNNQRESYEGSYFRPEGRKTNFWVPVLYYEKLPRDLESDGYSENEIKGILGYVSVNPGPNKIPIYEWEHNTRQEPENSNFIDHYYSTDPISPVAAYRYKRKGIIGYAHKEISSDIELPRGWTALFVGYYPQEFNHMLTTEKAEASHFQNFQFLGLVREEPGGDFTRPLKEFRKTDELYAKMHDSRYSAIMEDNSHYFGRYVIAGGDDNPLYEGGLALATFSLEHIHQVSPRSLEYAKLLFNFFEASEERSGNVLQKNTGNRTGLLRRRKHSWELASTWTASTDELVGIFLGLKYFIKATESDSPEYNERARKLLQRMAIYLKDHKWVYIDSRVQPTAQDYVDTFHNRNFNNTKKWVERGMYSLVFQYPFSRVLKEVFGVSYTLPIENAEEIAGVFINDIEPAILRNYIALWFGLFLTSGLVDSNKTLYKLLISTIMLYENRKTVEDDGKIKDFFPFVNHALFLYTGLMILLSKIVKSENQKMFALVFLNYVYDMWGRTLFHYKARKNVLFAVVAKRCFQLVTIDEAADSLGISGPDWFKRNCTNDYVNEIDEIIEEYIKKPLEGPKQWQPDLPLGGAWDNNESPHEPFHPWEVKITCSGLGRNCAWRYKNESFKIPQSRDPEKTFNRYGPLYKDEARSWSTDKTIEKLRRFARVGFNIGEPEYEKLISFIHGDSILRFQIEAGGNDYMFMRMLLTEMGVMCKPILKDKKHRYNVLPIDGALPF